MYDNESATKRFLLKPNIYYVDRKCSEKIYIIYNKNS